MTPRAAAAVALATALVLLACGGGNSGPAAAPAYQVVIESVPLIGAPRVAAAPDGTAWLAWAEGPYGDEAIAAASVDAARRVNRSSVSAAAGTVQREVQIAIAGSTPLAVWHSLSNSSVFRVHAAAHAAGVWRPELAVEVSPDGGSQLLPLPGGEVMMLWLRAEASGAASVVAARRSAGGVWSEPSPVAGVAGDFGVGLLKAAAADDGSVMVIWTETPRSVGTTLQPQVLNSARFSAATGRWRAREPADLQGGFYAQYDLVATPAGGWLAVWMSGSPSGLSGVQSKRWSGGTWDATPTRVDDGADPSVRQLALAVQGSRVDLVWTGLTEPLGSSSVRAARFDTALGSWSASRLVSSVSGVYPMLSRAVSRAGGPVVVAWNVSQGEHAGAFWASQGAAGQWLAPALLDLGREGFGPDLSLFSPRDLVAAWYRHEPMGRTDLVVRRLTLPP